MPFSQSGFDIIECLQDTHDKAEPAQNSSTGAATATTVAATTTTAIATKYLLMSLPAWQKAEPQGEPRNTRVRPDQTRARQTRQTIRLPCHIYVHVQHVHQASSKPSTNATLPQRQRQRCINQHDDGDGAVNFQVQSLPDPKLIEYFKLCIFNNVQQQPAAICGRKCKAAATTTTLQQQQPPLVVVILTFD